jgi:hypothetical protein
MIWRREARRRGVTVSAEACPHHFTLTDAALAGSEEFWRSDGKEFLRQAKGVAAPVHFRLYRVHPGSGKLLWEYYRDEEPIDLAVDQNRLLLVFPERVELLKFLSL